MGACELDQFPAPIFGGQFQAPRIVIHLDGMAQTGNAIEDLNPRHPIWLPKSRNAKAASGNAQYRERLQRADWLFLRCLQPHGHWKVDGEQQRHRRCNPHVSGGK